MGGPQSRLWVHKPQITPEVGNFRFALASRRYEYTS